MIRLVTMVVFALLVSAVSAQEKYPSININTDAEHIARLKAINRDIWLPFSQAYALGDVDAYLELHVPDVVRADKYQIKGMEGHRRSSKQHFDNNIADKRRCEIAFTFFERVASTDLASERGIYRYTAISETGDRQDYYGKFHVILRLHQGKWRIAVDYDSDEDGSIGKGDFEAGVPPDNFENIDRTAILYAIAIDDSLGRARNHACERMPLSATILEYIAGMEKIDFSDCPPDFTNGFLQHIDAWSALLPFTDKYPNLRGEMHDLFKQLEVGPDGEAFKAAVKKVWDTWAIVDNAMKANGL